MTPDAFLAGNGWRVMVTLLDLTLILLVFRVLSVAARVDARLTALAARTDAGVSKAAALTQVAVITADTARHEIGGKADGVAAKVDAARAALSAVAAKVDDARATLSAIAGQTPLHTPLRDDQLFPGDHP